jgi:5'(3')-deoxyribonucleotidase
MLNKRLRIAVDMDEVLADTHHKFLMLFNRDFQIPMDLQQSPGKELFENLPVELDGQWEKYVNEKGFFRDIPVMEHAQNVMKKLHEKHDVYIVSAAMEFRNSLEDKFDWIGEHFPFINWTQVLFTGDKIISADVLIDDRSKNFENFKGRKILYSSPHNLLLTGFERVNNWTEIAEKFDVLDNSLAGK